MAIDPVVLYAALVGASANNSVSCNGANTQESIGNNIAEVVIAPPGLATGQALALEHVQASPGGGIHDITILNSDQEVCFTYEQVPLRRKREILSNDPLAGNIVLIALTEQQLQNFNASAQASIQKCSSIKHQVVKSYNGFVPQGALDYLASVPDIVIMTDTELAAPGRILFTAKGQVQNLVEVSVAGTELGDPRTTAWAKLYSGTGTFALDMELQATFAPS